jgi:hypothetical protein
MALIDLDSVELTYEDICPLSELLLRRFGHGYSLFYQREGSQPRIL